MSFLLKVDMVIIESGLLREGMEVKMKFDVYFFQDYGVVGGWLKEIFFILKMQEIVQGNVVIYELKVELDEYCIFIVNECVVLCLGDMVMVEVVVCQCCLIDFIFDLFKKL